MKSTMVFAAKRAIHDLLVANADVGEPLDGFQVAYSYPARDAGRKMIYLGAGRFVHVDEAEEFDLVVSETINIGLYIRVLLPGGTVQAADEIVESAADVATGLFEANPKLAGIMTWVGVASGNSDYAETPDGPESVLSLQVLVGAVLV